MSYFLDRLSEPSTWRGLILLLTGAGVAVKPDLMEGIVTAGTLAAGTIGVVTKGR